jgi:trehalose synthase
VVGTRVGGIQDQIVDGESGLLIDDPHDLEALAGAIRSLAEDRDRAAEIGERARARVRKAYLSPIRLAEYVDLVSRIDQGGAR